MRASVDLQDKLAKQNDISRRRLSQELEKLEKVEKSDLRMIDTERQRFRSRHKKLELGQNLATSNPVNVRMYETHNPGFCYHCTGVIKESGPSCTKSSSKDSYELVRSLLFTNGEVDPEKVLCLHLIAAHTTDDANIKPVKFLLEQGKRKSLSGAWNNILPCYIIDTRDSSNEVVNNIKLHEDRLKINLEDEAIRYFERRYKRYVEENGELGKTLPGSARKTRAALSGFRRIPRISPHVYSLLGASHEMRIKQAMTDGRRKFGRLRNGLDILEEENLSVGFDENDGRSSRMTGGLSSKNWNLKPSFLYSRKVAHRSLNFDQRITMLRVGHDKALEHSLLGSKYNIPSKELITIKSSYKPTIKGTISPSSSIKSHLCNISENISTTDSCTSNALAAGAQLRKYRKRIYLNAPIRSIELRDKNQRTVPVLVNYQIEALIQSILDVLGQVSSDKLRQIIELARDPEELMKLLIRPEMQAFIQSLLGQSFISSPESFVFSTATLANELDLKFEGLVEKEVVALSLEVPDLPELSALINEIRNNIFIDANKKEPSDKGEKTNRARGTLKESQEYSVLEESKSQILVNMDLVEPPDLPIKLDTDRPNDSSAPVLNQAVVLSSVKTSFLERAYQISSNSIDKYSKERRPSVLGESCQGSTNASFKSSVTLKSRRSWQDSNYVDVDNIILRRMTNNQRILIGQTCASLKAKRINREGLIDERMPLAALITPTFSRDSIKVLTRGTIYSKSKEKAEQLDGKSEVTRDEEKQEIVGTDKLTGPLLAKIRQEVAEKETKQRLRSFLQTPLN